MKFNERFLNIVMLSKPPLFMSSLFHSLTTYGKKCEKIMLNSQQGIILRAPRWVSYIDLSDQVE